VSDFEEREYASFITVSTGPVGGSDGPVEVVLSYAAYRLHVYASVVAFGAGHPGFVSDEYLAEIPLDASTTTAELVAGGVWQRSDGGYLVRDEQTLEFADVATRWADAVEANCLGGLGHVPDPTAPGRCARCHGPLGEPGR